MRNRFVVFALILSSVFAVSCIDIVEELWINADKSGEAHFKIDAGSLGWMISSAGQYIDTEMLDEIIKAPNDKVKKLKSIEGITEVEAINLVKSGNIGFKFKFANPKALNKAYYRIFGLEKNGIIRLFLKSKNTNSNAKTQLPIFRNICSKTRKTLKTKTYCK